MLTGLTLPPLTMFVEFVSIDKLLLCAGRVCQLGFSLTSFPHSLGWGTSITHNQSMSQCRKDLQKLSCKDWRPLALKCWMRPCSYPASSALMSMKCPDG